MRMAERSRRHRHILDLIQRGGISSQEQLAGMLQRAGIDVTQATLSRDLRELGVLKGSTGYRLPGDQPPAHNSNGELAQALKELLIKSEHGGNVAVLHTGPGRAPLLALQIDRSRPPGVLGTVAGDDTIFMAMRTPRDAARVIREFEQLTGRRGRR
jgi:transcriptional regulator of arginine metabolism